MEWKCKKCNSPQENLYIQSKGTQTGLYCRNCGSWLKWLNKKEIRIAQVDGLLFVEETLNVLNANYEDDKNINRGKRTNLKLFEDAVNNNFQEVFLQEDKKYKKLLRFKEYFDELYGQGLQVANWNMNGTLVAFDEFYDSAIDYMEEIENEL